MPSDQAFANMNGSGAIAGTGFIEGPDSSDHQHVTNAMRGGVNVGNAIAGIATGGAAVGGPIGYGVSLAVNSAITGYEANSDLGTTQTQVAELKKLKASHPPGGAVDAQSVEILEWQINKFQRRTRYDHAESGGYSKFKKGLSFGRKSMKNTDTGSKTGKAKWAAKTAGMGVSTVVGASGVAVAAVGGQTGSKLTRMARGIAKKTGMMGSKRVGYADTLYTLATKRPPCPLAKEMVTLMLAKQQQTGDMKAKIDKILKSELAKSMSSYKGT